MIWIWCLIGVLAVAAAVRHLWRRRAIYSSRRLDRLDDDAVRRIIEEGRLERAEDDAPLDMRAAAEAEEEFWSESWNEPEEYGR